ncbi:MAG: TonB-dependent receptor [Betaproteobacteria bacterium]|nr:TonB-dependent receptor [Betaproteobacteria bacterium]
MTHLRMKVLPKALLAALVVSPLAFAQQAPAPQKVEKIEVTGSNIKRVDAEGSAPIQIISREEIENSGKQTVTELLRTLPTNAGGGLNDITGSNSFSSGASTVSLRGLGSAATLVLLNGRRIAPFGPADPNFGQSAVVNLDSLPLDVVDRVEILKDGASAIYGSEAVAGVVNIILRKDYTGAQVTGVFSMNRDSEYMVSRASTTLGFGDLARDRYNVFMNYERVEREVTKVDDVINYILYPTLQTNASFATFARYGSSYAGNYLNGVYNLATGQATATAFRPTVQQPANCNPGAVRINGVCRWDVPSRQDIVPQSDRDNFFARGSIDFSANLSGFAEFGFNRTKTFYRGNPQVYGDFGVWYSSTEGRLVNLPEFLPATHPNNPFGTPVILRHRFTEVGNGDRETESEATRVVAGLKGLWGTIDWEAGVLFSKNETDVTQYNQIRRTPLTQGVLNGTYNFLNPTAGAIKPSDLRINTKDHAESEFTIIDVNGSKELMQLSGGPMAIAAGIEFRKEDRVANPDPEKLRGEVIGFGAAFADGERDVTSAFAELSVPFMKNVEMQLAARTDKYSDYGRSTTPKVGIKWKVVPSFAVRGSFAEGFRAPSLTEISRSSVTAFYNGITDPKRCLLGTEPACAQTAAALLENAQRLDPETSKSYNLGFIWEPIKDLSLTVDYFDIRRRSEITLLDPDLILANEGATTGVYANRVVRGPVLPGETFGPLQAIKTFFFNSGQTNVKGYDVEARWNVNLGAYGKLRNSFAMTYYDSYNGNSADSEPLTEFAGYGFPRYRGTARTVWDYRDFVVGLTGNFNKGYSVLRDPNLTCSTAIRNSQPDCVVHSNVTADLSVQYTGIKKLTLNFVAQNLFDRKPPLDANARPVNFTYHPFRSIYYTLAATYRFK